MFSFRKKSNRRGVQGPAESRVPDGSEPPLQGDLPAPAEGPIARERRRPTNANRTRLLGLDASDGRVVDLFGEGETSEEGVRITFPVGLLMIVRGPGRGECFVLNPGMSQIGRGEDQAVCLDFGDMAISRSNHAAIVYDPKEHGFLLGHGGKSNIVRLNGKPVVSTAELSDGDEIAIGETTMRFVALCSPAFNWEESDTETGGEDDDDMEIA